MSAKRPAMQFVQWQGSMSIETGSRRLHYLIYSPPLQHMILYAQRLVMIATIRFTAATTQHNTADYTVPRTCRNIHLDGHLRFLLFLFFALAFPCASSCVLCSILEAPGSALPIAGDSSANDATSVTCLACIVLVTSLARSWKRFKNRAERVRNCRH
jgi:hypothetical protein